VGGGEVKDLIKVISSYFIFSNDFAASSSKGRTFYKSDSHEIFSSPASFL
jgi:hypothetical protein